MAGHAFGLLGFRFRVQGLGLGFCSRVWHIRRSSPEDIEPSKKLGVTV